MESLSLPGSFILAKQGLRVFTARWNSEWQWVVCILRGETWVVINLCQFTNTGLLISLLATVSFLSFSHLIEKQTEEYRRQSCPKPQKSNTMLFWSQYENHCFLQSVSTLMCPPETLQTHMSSPKSHYQVIPEFVGTSEVPSDTAWTSFAVV